MTDSVGTHIRTPPKSNAGGGVADKLGNKYELAWAVSHALRCLQNERRSLTIEDLDPELADGSEFTFIDEHGVVSVTQVKRQHSINDHWTVAALRSRGIFEAAERHVAAGREYHFSSMTPCANLRVLSEWARQSSDVEQFVRQQLTKTTGPVFDELSSPDVFRSAEKAWQVLRGMWFEVGDEQQLIKANATIASSLLEGAPEPLLPVAVGDVLLDALRKKVTGRELLEALARRGITPRGEVAKKSIRDEVRATTQSWLRSVEREFLSPPIIREESAALVKLMSTTRLALVVGPGGGGKSAVVHWAANELMKQGAEVLAFRLDRRGSFNSTVELGTQLGLSASPVASLRVAADGRDAVLVIDQLDAVSLASGRLSDRYNVIADLIDEAMASERMQIILVCRLFDVDNDHRLRKLGSRSDVKRLIVSPLTDDAITAAVENMGLNPGALKTPQRDLLRSPLNLVLLESISSRAEALDFTSRGSLFEAFWERKRQAVRDHHPGTRFSETITRIADAASAQQNLSIPVEALDADDFIIDAQVLASEQILSIDDGRVAFFHETFFDYAFARQWLTRDQALVEFLTAQEQEIFRRAQVRQILELLRERDVARFRAEVEATLLSAVVRFHIKETVASVFANVDEPTDEDFDLVLSITERNSSIAGRLWQQVCRPNWFGLAHSRGTLDEWLDSDEDVVRERAIAWLANAGAHYDSAVVELLRARRDQGDYAQRLQHVLHRSELHGSRELFDLLLEAVHAGQIDPWDRTVRVATYGLAESRPLWAIELLSARLAQPASCATDSMGRVAILERREHGLTQTIETSSRSEPRGFAEAVVPYLLTVMAKTAFGDRGDRILRDRQFAFRLGSGDEIHDLGDALFVHAASALRRWSAADPISIEPLLRHLAESKYDSAQALLFRAVVGNPEHLAPWIVDVLLEGGDRLRCGIASDSNWLSRECVGAIAPFISDEKHLRLEGMLRDYRATYERGPSFGYTAFKFLSALDRGRLSPVGVRRLAEYQRKFRADEPTRPKGLISYTVGSPIDPSATRKMSNTQWLRAISKHSEESSDRRQDPWVGGARELSFALKERTAEDPVRFAGLALTLTGATNPAYLSAILMGFGEATAIPAPALPAVFDAVRHIADLGISECDRWLGWSVRPLMDDVPLDVVERILNRALHASDPSEDATADWGRLDDESGRDLRHRGINTARGSLAEHLGDLLVHDADGERTELVRPHLMALANDSALAVRACVAHTVAASLRHARSAAYVAFECLIDADDILLASHPVRQLMMYVGNVNPECVEPVIDRMLASSDDYVKESGGSMAAFAALQWERPYLLTRALAGVAPVRRGAAEVCCARVGIAADSKLVSDALRSLSHDEDEGVREKLGQAFNSMRGEKLRPYARLIADLIASPSYPHIAAELFAALEEAPDQVGDLVGLAAKRFLDIHGGETADVRTSAAADAHTLSTLIVRGLAQASNGKLVSELLDVLDRLLELGVYSAYSAVEQAERR